MPNLEHARALYEKGDTLDDYTAKLDAAGIEYELLTKRTPYADKRTRGTLVRTDVMVDDGPGRKSSAAPPFTWQE